MRLFRYGALLVFPIGPESYAAPHSSSTNISWDQVAVLAVQLDLTAGHAWSSHGSIGSLLRMYLTRSYMMMDSMVMLLDFSIYFVPCLIRLSYQDFK